MSTVALRRELEHAIDDFLAGYPRDAEALLRCLSTQKIELFTPGDLEAHDAKTTKGVVQYVQDAIIDGFKAERVIEAIDPKTRETVQVVRVDDIAAWVDETIDEALTE